jgi:membrane protein YqaA with SNARE-associated domain
MLRRLYDWTLALAAHRHARLALAGVSFAESSFFPIPPDVVLIPMIIADRAAAWRLALITTVASVVGGLAGYAIGYFLFDLVGRPILDLYGLEAAFADFARRYNEHGAWIVFIAGLTPIPYKLVTIASGATALDPLVFMVASVAARGLRFFVVAGLLYWLGPPIRVFIEERLALVFTIFVIGLVGGFVVVKYLI